MNFKRISKWITNFSPILITVLSAVLASKYPITIFHIPEVRIYGLSLSTYSATLTLIINGFAFCLKKIDSSIKITYSLTQSNFPDNKVIYSSFNSDIATVYSKITVDGKSKRLRNTKIKIVFPLQVEIQGLKDFKKFYKINNKDRVIILKISDIFNFEKEEFLEDSKIIGFHVIKNDEEVESYIETTIQDKPRFVHIIRNEVKFTK